MPATFDLVTLDSPHPLGLADFWCAALALSVVENEDDGRWLVLADGSGERRLGLQRGPVRAGSIHLDLASTPDEFDTERQRLELLGARQLSAPRHESYGSIVNLADPDGNPFDLCAYR